MPGDGFRDFVAAPRAGWLGLIGGGEFSFGETIDADAAWLEETGPGPVGFVPAASGSQDYARHFGVYLATGLAERLGDEAEDCHRRTLELVPIYRDRDARRGKNLERLGGLPAVYLGGGVTDHLLDALVGTLAAEVLAVKWRGGVAGEALEPPPSRDLSASPPATAPAVVPPGVVVAVAAAAQCCGVAARSISGGELVPAFGWLAGGVVEPNFDPGHDRRLRKLLSAPGATWGLGLPAGSALLFGPDGRVEVVGTVFVLADADGDLAPLGDG